MRENRPYTVHLYCPYCLYCAVLLLPSSSRDVPFLSTSERELYDIDTLQFLSSYTDCRRVGFLSIASSRILTYSINGNADNLLLTINTSQVLIHFEDKLLVKHFVIDSFSFFRLTFPFCSSNSTDFLEDLRESFGRLGKLVSSLQ